MLPCHTAKHTSQLHRMPAGAQAGGTAGHIDGRAWEHAGSARAVGCMVMHRVRSLHGPAQLCMLHNGAPTFAHRHCKRVRDFGERQAAAMWVGVVQHK